MITALLSFLTFAVGYITGFIISDFNRKQEFSSNDEMHHPNKG